MQDPSAWMGKWVRGFPSSQRDFFLKGKKFFFENEVLSPTKFPRLTLHSIACLCLGDFNRSGQAHLENHLRDPEGCWSGLCHWSQKLFQLLKGVRARVCLPACLLELLLCCGSTEGSNSLAPEEFEASWETRASLGENQGSLCVASPRISSLPSRRTGMTKGALREPHSLVEAHGPHSSEQRRTGSAFL